MFPFSYNFYFGRGADINKSGFGPSTVILCDQVLFHLSMPVCLVFSLIIDINMDLSKSTVGLQLSTMDFFDFSQCEKEYHVGCLKKNKMADLKVHMHIIFS